MRRTGTLVLGSALAAALASCKWLSPNPSPATDCSEQRLDSLGNLPSGVDPASIVAVSQQGPLQAAHPEFDTSTDEWYGPWLAKDCPTLGGMEPAPEPVDPQAIQAITLLDHAKPALDNLPASPLATNLQPFSPAVLDTACGPAPCASLLPTGSPFGGADIIYVHGLQISPTMDVLQGGSSKPAWPADAPDFLTPGGYWRKEAQSYWATHVVELLDTRAAKNRVLFVGWSPLQRVEYAAHTMLAQIAAAMQTGIGVELRDPTDPRGQKGFCQPSCIVVSHSTGGLVTDIALSLAANPGAAPGPYVAAFQGLGWIPDHVRVQVALGVPFSGSQYAQAAVAIAAGLASPSSALCPPAMGLLTGPTTNCPSLSPLLHSVLRDLMPEIAQGTWGPIVAATPVPVVTIAGGNHGKYYPAKRFMNAGLDDGVVNMDSGCGRSVPYQAWPSGYTPWLWMRVYDMGIPVSRAVLFYPEQRLEPTWSPMPGPRASAACSPWKSSTGMVQPVAGFMAVAANGPFAYHPGHYSFIQTSESHTDGLRDCHEKAAEDVLAIATPLPYTLIGGGIANLQEEHVVGSQIPLTKKWIWKRTYHRLQGWSGRCAADYAYDWVL